MRLVSPNNAVWAVLLFCLAAAPVQVQAQDITSLQTCLNLAKQHSAQQVNIQEDCPGLFKQLQIDGLLDSVEPPFKTEVAIGQLESLADSLHSVRKYQTVSQDGLDRLLTDILTVETDDPEWDWWQAVLKWLDSIKPAEYEAQYQWLQHWLEAIKPSEQAVQLLVYALVASLLALSIWLVVKELHQAGFFRRFSGETQPFMPRDAHTLTSTSHPTITALTPRGEFAALLAQAINALVQRNLLPADPSLTPRQLIACLEQQPGDLDAAFSQVVYASEPRLYGDHAIDRSQLNDYRRQIEALLGKVSS